MGPQTKELVRDASSDNALDERGAPNSQYFKAVLANSHENKNAEH